MVRYTGPEILLQKQFRPPLGKVVIEVPAGLVEACESAEQAAVRELKEETGYVSTVAETGPVLFNGLYMPPSLPPYPYTVKPAPLLYCSTDPGFCNTNQRMVHVYIDGSHPSNQLSALRPELEDNEFIEVFTLPLASLREECRKLESQGYAIDAIIGSLAEGLEISRLFRGNKSDVGVK
jgi:ADP-ribose pyrophosphatase